MAWLSVRVETQRGIAGGDREREKATAKQHTHKAKNNKPNKFYHSFSATSFSYFFFMTLTAGRLCVSMG